MIIALTILLILCLVWLGGLTWWVFRQKPITVEDVLNAPIVNMPVPQGPISAGQAIERARAATRRHRAPGRALLRSILAAKQAKQ